MGHAITRGQNPSVAVGSPHQQVLNCYLLDVKVLLGSSIRVNQALAPDTLYVHCRELFIFIEQSDLAL